MSKKITIGAALALALLMVAASIPLTMLYAQNMHNQIIADLPERVEQFQALEEIRAVIQNEFYRPFNADAITAEMVSGYIEGLGDDLSRFLSAEEYAAFLQRIAGQQPELGLELRYDPNPEGVPHEDMMEGIRYDGLVVSHVRMDSPAERAGLRSGDRITRVETITAVVYDEDDLTTENAVEHLTRIANIGVGGAEEYSDAIESAVSVTITFTRDGETRPPVSVMIGDSVPTIATELMAPAATEENPYPESTVGYIRIFAFYRNTARQLQRAIEELRGSGATTFIIDLRGVSEGTLEYAVESIDLLAPTGDPIATLHFRGDTPPQAFPPSAFNIIPVVTDGIAILINQFTAGPAELFAYALDAYHPFVTLVGRPTQGVNTVQRDFPLAQVGGAALISVGTVMPVGDNPDWNLGGVQPSLDIHGEAPQLQQAINHLTTTEE